MSFFVQTAGTYYRPLSGRYADGKLDGCGDDPTRIIKSGKYVAIQQWFAEKHPVPCI